MKSKDGYQLFKNEDGGHYPYYCKMYLVDGRNVEGVPEAGNFTLDELDKVGTMKEVTETVRQYKNQYHHIDVWEEIWECELDEWGWVRCGDMASQKVHTYVNGKRVASDGLL